MRTSINLFHTGAIMKCEGWRDEEEMIMANMIIDLHQKYDIDFISHMTGISKKKLTQETYTFTIDQFRNTLDFFLKSKNNLI